MGYENPEKRRTRLRKYFAEHRDELNRKYRERYVQNRDAYRRRARLRYQKVKQYIDKYKSNHPCVDCGATENLQFDHVIVRERVNGKSPKSMHSLSMNKLKREIEKCVIRCKPCHAKRHGQLINIKRKHRKVNNQCPYCGHPL